MKELIANLLANELKKKADEIINLIEIPPQSELGDYAFPCFSLTKEYDKNPAEIAKILSSKIKAKELEKIEVKGPYLNFFINKKILAELAIKIGNDFGKGKNKEKILLEHTSVNPNASPHVGRARNSIIGDSVKRILEFSGHEVETHYYVNDVSKQIAMLALNFKPKDTFDDLLKKYMEISLRVKNNPKLEEKVFQLLHKFEHNDQVTVALFKRIVDTAVLGQKEIFSSLGIEFDYFDYESRYMGAGKEVLKELGKTGKLFTDEENRLVLNQKGTGLEVKMKAPVLVLTRNDGTGLYILRDLAYTIEKCKKAKNILVLGEDQKLYFEQLKHALILLGKPYPQVVHYSFVLLKDIGKMSTRRGEVVLLEDFLDEATKKAKAAIKEKKTKGDAKKIAIAAVKYAMLRNENDKNITFDMEQALNFEGDSGPYLQYAYARASSIIKKAKMSKSKIENEKIDEKEFLLIKKLLQFPETVAHSYKQLAPHIIASYSFELAQMFNEFYHSCPVLGDKKEAFRIKLVEAFRHVMKNSLNLLGIEAIEEM